MRVRTFTPDCDIDAGAMPLVWLNDVKADDSIAWLASLVTAAARGVEGVRELSAELAEGVRRTVAPA